MEHPGASPPGRLSLSKYMHVCTVTIPTRLKVRGELDDAVATGKGLFVFPHHVHEARQPGGSQDFPVCLPSLHRSTEISHECYRGWLYLTLGDLSSDLHIHRTSTLPTKSSPYPFVLVSLNIRNIQNSPLISSKAHCSKQCCVVLSQGMCVCFWGQSCCWPLVSSHCSLKIHEDLFSCFFFF